MEMGNPPPSFGWPASALYILSISRPLRRGVTEPLFGSDVTRRLELRR